MSPGDKAVVTVHGLGWGLRARYGCELPPHRLHTPAPHSIHSAARSPASDVLVGHGGAGVAALSSGEDAARFAARNAEVGVVL
jgi:hypothetical protein